MSSPLDPDPRKWEEHDGLTNEFIPAEELARRGKIVTEEGTMTETKTKKQTRANGCWCVWDTDKVWVFPSEIRALRFAAEKKLDYGFVEWGGEVGK